MTSAVMGSTKGGATFLPGPLGTPGGPVRASSRPFRGRRARLLWQVLGGPGGRAAPEAG